MKILTADEMRRLDRLTSERAGVPSRQLMENAGRHVAEFLLGQFPSAKRVTILCGKGNNGGDALVAARHLLKQGLQPRAALLDCDVVVDGLLGTGITGAVEGYFRAVIADMNAPGRRFRVLAVDIPSGLPSASGEPLGESVRADATLTFTAPKRGQIFPSNCTHVGTLGVAPIGTPEELSAGDPALFLNLITA